MIFPIVFDYISFIPDVGAGCSQVSDLSRLQGHEDVQLPQRPRGSHATS